MSPLVAEPAISLLVREHEEPGIEIRVNFGVFAGRHATPAEIDELAMALRDLLPSFAIESEERHEFGEAVEAAVHKVVVDFMQGPGGAFASQGMRGAALRSSGRPCAHCPVHVTDV